MNLKYNSTINSNYVSTSTTIPKHSGRPKGPNPTLTTPPPKKLVGRPRKVYYGCIHKRRTPSVTHLGKGAYVIAPID